MSMEAASTTVAATPAPISVLTNRSRGRRADPALEWTLAGLAAFILVLITFFFVRLLIEALPAFEQTGVLSFVFTNDWVPSQNAFGALPLLVGHAHHVGHRAAHRRAGGDRDRAVRHRARADPGPPAPDDPRRAPGRGPVRRLRAVGHLLPGAEAAAGGEVVRRHVLLPALRGRERLHPELLRGRADPRDHDPADRQRDLPRGHGDRAEGDQGGRPRPRRDALGDDPDGRPALRPARDRRRVHARPGPRAGRDDRRDDRHRQRGRHRPLASSPRATAWRP